MYLVGVYLLRLSEVSLTPSGCQQQRAFAFGTPARGALAFDVTSGDASATPKGSSSLKASVKFGSSHGPLQIRFAVAYVMRSQG